MTGRPCVAALALIGLCAVLAACGSADQSRPVPGGDPAAGHAAIVALGCGSCHRIGGVKGADGEVGPDLRDFQARRYIIGSLPLTPDNVARWIRDPQAMRPDTIMPDLGVTQAQSRDIAAYLFGQ